MATFPSKVNYATGDILTATNMNDVGNAINTLNGAQYAAGKNAVINGDFGIWQRGTSFTIAATAYTADRWGYDVSTAVPSGTVSQQTFTPGTAPVAGYEGQFFHRSNVTANNGCTFMNNRTRIEDVRSLSGQTVTLSVWMKADAGTTMDITYAQVFGSGGSTTVNAAIGTASLSTSWQRFTYTFAVPSVSGKTIGAGSYLQISFNFPTSSGTVRVGTYDFWGVQLEAAQTASPFQTATGTKQGELAACQRYYYRQGGDASIQSFATGQAILTTVAFADIKHPVTMRVAPTAVDTSTASLLGLVVRGGSVTALNATPTIDAASKDITSLRCAVASGLTANQAYSFVSNSSTSAYVGLSAEL